ncbi:TonB-dependent receptor [Hyalangium rubrum]|uniref:TonB-dependent receptor n=1 Tax=Hyalangium rubrum TaxID=3103134 RepID=A0ABU5GW23_9BACT|nr:TonB-dependent receptor [Hyalangium sp. s54d21]MDY7225393.1 TonB-dependent receptor [Hyalangium sp. s54d21]
MAPSTRACVLLLGVALFAGPAAAHPPDAPEEAPVDWSQNLSLEELLQIELAAPSKQRQLAREAPGAASLVTRDQIRQFGWTSLNDLLFSQPGFFPSRDYERSVVGSRGLHEGWNNNHLLLLVDGVPVNDHDTGGAYTWDVTPLFLVRSVEIIRGPGSALYGSSATNGVVAINTISAPKTLTDDEHLEVNSEARLRLGNWGTASVEAVAATRSEHISAVLGFRYYDSDGVSYLSYDGSERIDDTGTLRRFLVREPLGSRYLYVKLEPRKALEGLSLSYHQQAWEQGTAHGWSFWVPDAEEPLREGRHLAVLRYHSPAASGLQHEYVLTFQRHDYDLDVRFYPSGAFDGFYPAGMTESLQTRMDEVFGRAQLSGELAERLSLLGGVEYSVFMYGGDEAHYSNVDLLNTGAGAPPSDERVELGPFYEAIIGHPVNNAAAYVQLAWSRLLDTPLSLTAGLRYDLKFFAYRDTTSFDDRVSRKAYEQFSPRLALVYAPTATLSLKLQASRAFRAPSPSELFSTNSWMADTDLETILPERVSTFEFTADWTLHRHLSWRTTAFHSRFENLIGYTGGQLGNLFSRRFAGVELELMADAELGARGRLMGFGNYSFVHLLGEVDGKSGTTETAERLTWAPAHTVKAGVSYRLRRFSAALQGRYQGSVRRREMDRLTPAFIDARPVSVPAWVRFDLNTRLQVNAWSAVGVSVTNLLNTESYLVRTGDLPFDYRMDARRFLISLEVNL